MLPGDPPFPLQALRKAVKKIAKHVEPMQPKEGYLGLEIEHPHKYGHKTVQVQPQVLHAAQLWHACNLLQ